MREALRSISASQPDRRDPIAIACPLFTLQPEVEEQGQEEQDQEQPSSDEGSEDNTNN
jgi:hypothetical protein